MKRYCNSVRKNKAATRERFVVCFTLPHFETDIETKKYPHEGLRWFK